MSALRNKIIRGIEEKLEIKPSSNFNETFDIALVVDGHIFVLRIGIMIFYQTFQSVLSRGKNRDILLQNKPLTDLELWVFQEIIRDWRKDMFIFRIVSFPSMQRWGLDAGFSTGRNYFTLSNPIIDNDLKLAPLDTSWLSKRNPPTLAHFLSWEHPQTVSLLLSNLNPDLAYEIACLLPLELRAEVTFSLLVQSKESCVFTEKIIRLIKLTETSYPFSETHKN